MESRKKQKNTKLAKRMGEAGLTYAGLAAASGVCEATICRLVAGYGCHARTAVKIAGALDCEPEALGFFGGRGKVKERSGK